MRNNTFVSEMLNRRKRLEQNYDKARELHKKGEYLASNEYLEKVIAEDSSDTLAMRYMDLNNSYIGLAKKREIVKINQEKIQLIAQARLEENQQLHQKIQNLFDQGKRSFEKGEYKKAMDYFIQALEVAPEHKLSLEYQGLTQRYLDFEHSEERIKLGEAKRKLQTESMNLFIEGKELYESEQYKASVRKFERAWKLNPNAEYMQDLQTYIENAYMHIQRKKEAKEKKEQERVKSRGEQVFHEGIIYFQEGSYEQAIHFFKKALSLDPKGTNVINIQMYLEKAFDGIKKRKRAEMLIVYDEAKHLYDKGSMREALKKFQKIHNKDPHFEDVQLYLKLIEKKR